jgi:HNH endonuclease
MTKEIDLNSKKKALIDDEDYDKVSGYKWYYSGRGYANTNKSIKMHRLIMDAPPGMVVDHINGNTLDNRKANLRIVKQSTNIRNGKLRSNNKSGFKGVNYHKARKQWRAYIMVDYKHINLGWFTVKEDAIKARLEAERRYFTL